jgi:hypothetical protein
LDLLDDVDMERCVGDGACADSLRMAAAIGKTDAAGASTCDGAVARYGSSSASALTIADVMPLP